MAATIIQEDPKSVPGFWEALAWLRQVADPSLIACTTRVLVSSFMYGLCLFLDSAMLVYLARPTLLKLYKPTVLPHSTNHLIEGHGKSNYMARGVEFRCSSPTPLEYELWRFVFLILANRCRYIQADGFFRIRPRVCAIRWNWYYSLEENYMGRVVLGSFYVPFLAVASIAVFLQAR